MISTTDRTAEASRAIREQWTAVAAYLAIVALVLTLLDQASRF